MKHGVECDPEKRALDPAARAEWYTQAMHHLVEVVQQLSLAHDLQAVMDVVRHAARTLTGADGATFVLRDGDQCFYAEEDAISPLWKGRRFPMSICISGWTMLHREPAVIEDIYADERIPADAYRPTFVKSLAMVPIRTQNPVGAIGNYWAKTYRPFPEQVKILQALADTTAVALENVRVYGELNQKVRDMAAVMQAAPVAIVSLDPEGAPVSWNHAAAQLFGGDPAGALSGEAPGIDRDSVQEYSQLLAMVRSGQVVRGETLKARGAADLVCDLRVSGAPIHNEDGTLRASLLVMQDETERNNLERQFLHAQKMEAVGQLTGGIAHDFNNLLGILIGNLDLVRERVKEDPETLEMLDAALDAGLRGADLNKRLLAFSRRQALQPQEVDINAAITTMVVLLQRFLGEQIRIRLSCGERIWPVQVDPVQLETAVVNLCINSRDAIPEDGILTIETENTSLDAEYVATRAELAPGDYVMIAVSDNGCGMPPAVLARAFDPFYTTKPVGKGTGLGLSMVYGFMKQSGGHVNIYSEPGRGTTVRLYLPRKADCADAAEKEDCTPIPRSLGQELVLVVEDDPELRCLAARQLDELGYRVETAPDADRALAAVIGGLRPALVFADVVMPGSMGGIELADRLRALYPDLPVLLSSGFTQRAMHEAKALLGNHSRYYILSKPYRKDDLARVLRKVLDGAGDEAAL